MRLSDYQGVPQRNLRKIGIPQHKPAISEESVGISVKERRLRVRQRVRIGRTQRRYQSGHARILGVIHTQKLEQTRVHSYPFKLTGG